MYKFLFYLYYYIMVPVEWLRNLKVTESVNETINKNTDNRNSGKYAENDSSSTPVLNLFFNIK